MFGLHRTTTSFPGNIDARSYYSDVSLQHTGVMDNYNRLIKQKEYKEASQYLYDTIEDQNLNLDYNGAYVWNRTDNQMVAIEDYAINVMEETNIRPHYSNSSPSTRWNQMTWITS